MFLSRLDQPGGSQTSHGGLENGMHTQEVSWVVVLICISLAIWLLSTPLYHRLVD